MKNLWISLLLMSSFAHASTKLEQFFNSEMAKKICQDSMVYNGNVFNNKLKLVYSDNEYVYFGFYQRNMTRIQIVNLKSGDKREISFEEKIQDIFVKENEVFYLSHNTLYIAEKETDKLVERLDTLPSHLSHGRYAIARGMYVKDNIIYIAHGKHGIMRYDRTFNKFLDPLNPAVPQPEAGHRSMITDVEGVNGKLYFTYDDVTLAKDTKAFEGLMIWDIKSNSKIKLVPVNQRKEAYYQANLTVDHDELIITNLHINFRHKLSKLESDNYMSPLQRIWRYPHGELLGRGHIQNGQIFGCFHNFTSKQSYPGYMKF